MLSFNLQVTQDEMFEWMTAIDAAIQGVPDKADQRMRSASVSYRKVVLYFVVILSSIHIYVGMLLI